LNEANDIKAYLWITWQSGRAICRVKPFECPRRFGRWSDLKVALPRPGRGVYAASASAHPHALFHVNALVFPDVGEPQSSKFDMAIKKMWVMISPRGEGTAVERLLYIRGAWSW